jgi:membrane-associated phospholipid phosphatase
MLRTTLLALTLLASRLQPAAAQTPGPASSASPAAPASFTATDSVASDSAAVVQQGQVRPLIAPRGLFKRSDAFLAAGFAAATVALFPLDKHFAEELQSPNAQTNSALDNTATRFEKIASPGAYYLGGGLYLVGRIAGWDRVADLGLHATESVVLAEGIGYVLKRTIGRSRPYVSNTADPRDFSFGTGFGTGDRRSFPSGHTYTAFAVASAVTSETREWWPGSTWLIAPIMYGGATMVGLSRMYHNQHWASDIVLGAAVGTFSGLKLVQFMHANPGNRGDRFMLGSPVVRRHHDATQLGWQLQF